jgi:hypothetical protein
VTVDIYHNGYACRDGYPTDAGDIGVPLKVAYAATVHRADADGVRLFSTNVADINVVIARSENTGRIPNAMLLLPVVLSSNAPKPMAVFLPPVVLVLSA